MGAVNINGFREKITAALYFKQNPRKNHLNNIFCKTMPEVITDCGKMGTGSFSGYPGNHLYTIFMLISSACAAATGARTDAGSAPS